MKAQHDSLRAGEKILIHDHTGDWQLTLETVDPKANPADRDDDTNYRITGTAKLIRDNTEKGMQAAFHARRGPDLP